MRKGFTIAELVIVVCIIGILAAIVIPLFQNQASMARGAAAKDNLRVLRSAIELYAAQHKGVAPGYENNIAGGALDQEYFRQQTTVTEHYMPKLPENSFNNLSTIRMIADGAAFPTTATGTYGWTYQAATGMIRLDWPGADDKGVAYIDY
jgi:prepilin-type N-terminal cleavage/methylation domain-containing protein